MTYLRRRQDGAGATPQSAASTAHAPAPTLRHKADRPRSRAPSPAYAPVTDGSALSWGKAARGLRPRHNAAPANRFARVYQFHGRPSARAGSANPQSRAGPPYRSWAPTAPQPAPRKSFLPAAFRIAGPSAAAREA